MTSSGSHVHPGLATAGLAMDGFAIGTAEFEAMSLLPYVSAGLGIGELTLVDTVDHAAEVSGQGTLAQSMARQKRLQELVVGSRRRQQDMIRAIEATGIRSVLDRSFDLPAIVEAFRFQAWADHFGNIAPQVAA